MRGAGHEFSCVKLSFPAARRVLPLGKISNCLAREEIGHRIRAVRGHLVLFDTDLAEILGVPAERLEKELFRHDPLPGYFWFLLEPSESVLSQLHGQTQR
ncbi:MAG: hypothetical protein EXS38_02300 [Opitutus sp.]|nr:hypothetical protein [Opitutus sp.]